MHGTSVHMSRWVLSPSHISDLPIHPQTGSFSVEAPAGPAPGLLLRGHPLWPS